MPLVTKEELEWKKDALCKEYPGYDWRGLGHSDAELKAMRGICDRCLVQGECRALVEAIEVPEDASAERFPSLGVMMITGFWAGETALERIRRRCAEYEYPISDWMVRRCDAGS